MQTEQFVNDVAKAAGIDEHAQAYAVSRAVIETICVYLPPEQTRRLASQLPRELAQAAEDGARQALQTDKGVSVDTFFNEVARRADMPVAEVTEPARVAIQEFKQALSRSESVDVVLEAPAELDALLTG
ncbi:DUF2267 domain-containing protein [Salinisphaera sp. T31B1]|uniref:DUF2267 domain-containing protein n=1 Tax=Salinisphaera sp. T31B1 TaxID=727963 RepID=UPI00333F1078